MRDNEVFCCSRFLVKLCFYISDSDMIMYTNLDIGLCLIKIINFVSYFDFCHKKINEPVVLTTISILYKLKMT